MDEVTRRHCEKCGRQEDHTNMGECDRANREKRSRARLRRGRAFHPIHNPDGDTSINFHTGNYQEG